MNPTNIIRCDICDRNYIDEEFEIHKCEELSIVIFDTNGNRWGSYDRIKFFPLPPFKKISDESLQPSGTDEDLTAPDFGLNDSSNICYLDSAHLSKFY
jgi:hypothetical protein